MQLKYDQHHGQLRLTQDHSLNSTNQLNNNKKLYVADELIQIFNYLSLNTEN